jgi:hypothetical protein
VDFRYRTIALSSLLMLSAAAAPVVAQDDDQLAKVQHFEGGQLDLSIGAASLALLGPNAAGLQTTVAPIYPGPGRHLHNPALLGMSQRALLAADVGPRLDLDLASLFDLNGELSDASDDLFEDQLADDGVLVSSRANAGIRHPGGLSAASLVLPTSPARLAFSVDRAIELDLSLLATGIQTWADIEKEVGDVTEQVHMRADLDLSARLRLRAQRYSVAAGYAPRPDLWAGVGLDWLACLAQVNGLADVEGLMATSGREFAFGDPTDPWENSLDQSLSGRYEGGTWGLRLGGGWRPHPRLAVGLTWQHTMALDMSGQADLQLRRLAAFDDGGIDPGSLSLSQPTETEIVESPVDDHLSVEFPRSLTIGLASYLGPVSFSLDGSLYGGDFRLAYLDASSELRPRTLVKAGIYSSGFSLAAGVLLAEPRLVLDGDVTEPGLLPLPLLSLGGGGRITDHLRLDAVLSAAPLPGLRLSGTLIF